jgi:hypothetical protein
VTFSPELSRHAARDRIDGFRRQAERERRARRLLRDDVTIRLDRAGDASRLYQLAALCRRRLAAGPFLVADVGGRIVAARPVVGGSPVSDPSRETRDIERLLEVCVAQVGSP